MDYDAVMSVDIETYGEEDLLKVGTHRYAERSELLLFSFSVNCGEPEVIDVYHERRLPRRVTTMLEDPRIIKTAWNAAFERALLSFYMGYPLDPRQWDCTMIRAMVAGLPPALEKAGSVLRLPVQKNKSGKDLIKYFCQPCKPTKANEQRTRNLPAHAPEKWERFKIYVADDVRSENGVLRKLPNETFRTLIREAA